MTGTHRARRTLPDHARSAWRMRPDLMTVALILSLTLSACMACFTSAAAEPPADRRTVVDVTEQRSKHLDRPDRARPIERGQR